MSFTEHAGLEGCCDAVREVSETLMRNGHAERDVVNALLCELLALNCDTPAEVERYLDGLLTRFRRHRESIVAEFSRQACH